MSKVDVKLIKQLREETGASIGDIRKAVSEASGDEKKARENLKKISAKIAEKKADRQAGEGIIDAYIHQNGKVGVLLELKCETDFVAKTQDFQKLAHEVSMQIAAMNPEDIESLLDQDYIRDPSKKITDLIQEVIGKLGENIQISRFTRYSL